MEIICAGYGKTGTKTSSAALRQLGIKVADYPETALFLSEVWWKYCEDRATIEEVIEEYRKNGFQANQDFPGNLAWYELYKASPNAKVILTVRDSTEKWKTSLTNFMDQEHKRFGNPGTFLMERMAGSGFFGRKMVEMTLIGNFFIERYFFPGCRLDQWFYTWQQKSRYFHKFYDRAAVEYEKHNAFVKSVVPAERLLVWNVKEGWEPLCRFLNKPVPTEPIFHNNKTGDVKWIDNYMKESGLGTELEAEFYWSCKKLLAKMAVIGGVAFYMKRSGKFGALATRLEKPRELLSALLKPLIRS